ncbi:transposase [Streptomyces sp. NA04227]|uniref:IS701 family transposase n=1 Tax=Streptomyces sp. NA04227 TaxID=2742136 RepID=UPI0015912483|nr:transposase [Streptomyces sp. NA04227]QKW08433.1 transposase [Streptomyces sp. NA04227]
MSAAPPVAVALREEIVAPLADALLASLTRRHHRERGEQYLRGLLLARGRKSIRNIASAFGGSALEQSLHHFVSCSTWDWTPMRQALAAYVCQELQPKAWVLQSMQIPKMGEHSVGVDRRFLPRLGQTVNGQQAFGLWLAAPRASAPVNWRLFLPPAWLKDDARRRRAEIPEGLGEESLAACAATTVLDATRWGLPPRPVLLDARDGELRDTIDELRAHGLPFLARIGAHERVAVADTSMPGYGGGLLPAQQIMQSVSGLRRPVEYGDPASAVPAVRSTLVAGIRVLAPRSSRRVVRQAGAPGDTKPLLLLGMWDEPHQPPTELWLTDMAALSHPALTRLSKLAVRTELDYASTGERAGLSEFVGRSFQGWHRHLTLASAAHTALVLGADG